MTNPLSLSAAIAAQIAPSGVLRAAINLGNPILANTDAATGVPVGVSVDLACGFARLLGVELALQVFDGAAKAVDAVRSGAADIGFFAIDPLRGAGITFTAPYVLIEGSYMVAASSGLQKNEDVDQADTRIVVGKGSAYDLFLTREIKQASLVRAATSQAVVDLFVAEQMEVAAGVRQQLLADAKRLPGLRLLPGRFMVIEQAMGLAKNHSDDAARALFDYVEAMKKNGFVQEALERHGVSGAVLAPLSQNLDA
ncbi:Membrane-bound lytic murein transglycosylase F [Polaromonas vacuolata]|uniref:Membrane-bound lytic murein transglycosylase F n=1 Tax=Polaromonas vacuolata TaxID=37448 RepID=A0A6H2HDU3_9BURK|nr:transporter substrate-binding domain-containing protein [Polaromonas vacuolata]QJC58042.1 Membrane-bound lytic murein transglycosylase F [Polaromonas vacuolata]